MLYSTSDFGFKGLDFLQPQAELVQRYQQAVSPIADQLLNLQRRNQTLRRTRDLLLPKLLSGDDTSFRAGNPSENPEKSLRNK
jgi:hypothetical protein